MDKLKMHALDQVNANIERLAELFPSCVTEGRNEKGDITRVVDFDMLRQELADRVVEGPQERYRLDWPGKRESFLAANAPIAKTLRPQRQESVDFDRTKNLFIEGDNLEALKLLQENFLGKVKMIYIDPPYNTGKDFIYEDDFAESSADYLSRSNQQNEEGRLVVNVDSNGRFHSDWLSMMQSRLCLCRTLLTQDGILFISIDENEITNLEAICREVFGENNIMCRLIWKSKSGGANDSRHFAVDHEYILAIARNINYAKLNDDKKAEVTTNYSYKDEVGEYSLDRLDKQSLGYIESLDFPISGPDGTVYRVEHKNPSQKVARWRWSKKSVATRYDELVFKDGYVYTKNYKKDGAKPRSLLIDERFGRTRTGKTELVELMGLQVFDNPKPTKLIRFLLEIGSSSEDVVMDFFAGAGTTAHATMALNAETGTKRRWISIQLPEPTLPESDAYKAGYRSIADIAKERIRRAGKQIKGNYTRDPIDIGFRVFSIDTSNMADVYYRPDDLKQGDLLGQIDNVKPERTGEDLLFQVLLDWGVDLSLPITREFIEGLEVFFVDGNALAACFVTDGRVDEGIVKKLAVRKPLRVVFRDKGFAGDNARINVEQIFKTLSPDTEVRTI